ncbi:MAG: hypothetical protein AAF636_18125 [Pseudomonadota bacterium]
MAETGAMLREFPLRKALEHARAALQAATDQASRNTAMAHVADLEMRTNIALGTRKKFMS